DLKKFNTTHYPPNTFLKFASALNRLMEDGILTKEILQDVTHDTTVGVTWVYAWNHVVKLFERSDRDSILKNLFSKLDTVLPAVNTTEISGSLYVLWNNYITCSVLSPQTDDTCRATARNAWKYALQFVSVIFREAAGDLLTFFKEFYDPERNLLQVLGFTKKTVLYDMYENLGDFMGVLLNSYGDHVFMSEIRKASLSQFWDCESIVSALVPPPGSIIDSETITRIRPIICPSALYWLSLPVGDNTLLDVIAKPQYYFYTLDVNNLTSSYEEAYDNMNELSNLFIDIANKTQTLIKEEDITLDSLRHKLERLVDNVLNYKINSSDPSYRNFNDINKKQFATTIYLTRIVSIINKIVGNISNLNVSDDLQEI
ncbi:uncharacterized protein LOC113227658, partial [Hyposmocoma kahamanoa]|uniref:uncharacterized protein LOC113227658 n=1 Tax=Hyposmocoma kahamanoa TaxID=1477025 RepID=UPI000E6D7EAA